jgi:hypothetical protein
MTDGKVDGQLHVSQLYDLCTRQAAITIAENIPPEGRGKVVDVGDRVVWDVGKAVATVVRHWYLGPMGLLYGTWRCGTCQAAVDGLMPRQPCACGQQTWRYQEPVVVDAALGIVGSLDGLLPSRAEFGGGLGVLEIKSMEGALFRRLTRPVERHVHQVQTYLTIGGYEWGVILYVSKSYEAVPFKEFGLRRDAGHATRIAALVREVADGGTRKCRDAGTKRALGCFARSSCWFAASAPGRA